MRRRRGRGEPGTCFTPPRWPAAIGFGCLLCARHTSSATFDAPRPGVPASGWIAISGNYYPHRSTFKLLKQPCDPKSEYHDDDRIPPQPFAWLHAYQPVAMAGSSVRLYHIGDAADHDLQRR